MASRQNKRMWLISGAFIAFACLLGVRLYYLQVLNRDAFTAKADKQYIRSVSDVFSRGSIYFSNADGSTISAATLKTGYVLAISPERLQNPADAFEKISSTVPLDLASFMAKASKKDDPYEELAKHVDEEAAKKIDDLKIPGVNTYKEQWRYYPQGTLASQVLGFVGFKGDELTGRYGLESYYNSTLERKNKDVYVNFFAEMFSDIKSVYKNDSEGDVILTIEPTVQGFLEKKLKEVNDKYSSTMTAGIIMNPKTGEIAAMGAYPSFDPNNYQTEKNPGVFINPLVQGVYEMGSIIKPLTMAAGLDSGTVRPTSVYNDTGSLNVNGYTIYNFDKRGRGPGTTMQQVLNDSLNTGVAYVAEKMGKDQFSKYMFNYGLGEQTGVDLPNEARGLVANLNSPRDVEHATAAFGQGIALTPIETVRALSSLANGGVLVTPHVTKEIDYKSGLPKVIKPEVGQRVLSEQTSKDITQMLVTVVDKALLNGEVKMEKYSIAAKTGTAQMAREDGRGYYEDRYLHSFFGYFPAYNPQYIVFLFTVYPKGVSYASHTLTYPFIDIAKFMLSYYQVPPDRGE